MRLKNVLISVKNMERSINFYKNLFCLQVVLRQEGTVVLTEGLVLQDASLWRQSIDKDIFPENNASELYFEERDLEAFTEKLERYDPNVCYVTPLMMCPWGQKLVRFYDPDGNLIEVRTPTEYREDKKDISEADVEAKENLMWEEISTEHVVRDEWIDFRRSAYRFPDGKVFEPFYTYSRKDYVVIVATDEDGNYLCVRQFRQGIKKVTTEFPAGGIERTDGVEYGTGQDASLAEDALKAAQRELLEETGYVSENWNHLLTVPSNATMADNYAHIFTARNCRRLGGQSLDETEFLNVRNYTEAQIEKKIYRGDFQQAVHILAWMLAKRG